MKETVIIFEMKLERKSASTNFENPQIYNDTLAQQIYENHTTLDGPKKKCTRFTRGTTLPHSHCL